MNDLFSIRASSLSEIFDCPARFEAKYIRGLRLPKSSAAQLGTAIHAGTALFDQSRLDGNPLTIEECAGAVVDAIQKPEEDVDWGEDSKSDAENIGIALHKMYCTEIGAKQKYVAVEATCESLDIPDLGLSLTGTTDRIRVTDDGLGIADIKTGKSVVGADGKVKTSGHAAQLAVYQLLASQAIGQPVYAPAQIIGLQVAKTDKGRRAATGTVNASLELLVGKDETPGLLQHASKIIHSGAFYGNPRSSLCSEKYCPNYSKCQWR
jgi:hypothetical protein